MIDRYHILQASTYLKELVSFPHEWGGGGTFTCNLSLRCCFEQPASSYVACLRNSNTWSSQDTKPTTPPQLLNHSGSRMTTFLFLPLELPSEKNQSSVFFPWNQFHEIFSWNWYLFNYYNIFSWKLKSFFPKNSSNITGRGRLQRNRQHRRQIKTFEMNVGGLTK